MCFKGKPLPSAWHLLLKNGFRKRPSDRRTGKSKVNLLFCYLIGVYPLRQSLVRDITPTASPSPMLLPSAIGTAMDVGIRVIGARNRFGLVPKEDSLVNHKENLVGDIGLMMGRSFRVGWGPGFVLVHCGSPLGSHKKISGNPASQTTRIGGLLSPRPKPSHSASAFSVTIEKLQVASHFNQGKDVVLVSIKFKGLDIVNILLTSVIVKRCKAGKLITLREARLRGWVAGPESIPDHPLELST